MQHVLRSSDVFCMSSISRDSPRLTLFLVTHPSSSQRIDKLIDQSAGNVGLPDDSLLVVLAYGTTQLVIVHSWAVLPDAPQPGHVSRVLYFENSYGQRNQNKISLV